MSNLKDTVDKIRNLEAEKMSLLAEIQELQKMADTKASALQNEIAMLRDEIKSLRVLMVQEKPQPSSDEPLEEKKLIGTKELVERTLGASDKLGDQVFAVSPFSQYFDDWLVNLQQVISDFEVNSTLKMDEQFVQDRSKILHDVEGALAQKRVEESSVNSVAKALEDNNHLLDETNKEYDEKSKDLNAKREPEVARITYRIHELERDMQNQEESKNKMFKKRTADKLAQTKLDLESARRELEATQQKLAAEQDNLRDSYAKKKQEILERGESLHKELEKLETDNSIEARQAASKALVNAVNALVQRNSSIA